MIKIIIKIIRILKDPMKISLIYLKYKFSSSLVLIFFFLRKIIKSLKFLKTKLIKLIKLIRFKNSYIKKEKNKAKK